MKNIKFSVVVPLYNKQEHILDCIASILSQSITVDEIIVVNDGSVDKGAERLAQQQIAHVKLIHQENQGVSVARNRGIAACRNDYVAFLDADDEWLPFFLEDMQLLIQRFPHSRYFASRYQCVIGGDFVDAKIDLGPLDPEGILLDNYFEVAANGDLPFMISSSVIHKSLVDTIGGFPPGERIGEDQDFFARAAMAGPIAYSPNIHLHYRCDAQNSATDMHVPTEECPFSRRLAKPTEKYQASHAPEQQVAKYSAAHLCHLAKLNIQKGRFDTARKLLSDQRCQLKSKHKWGLTVMSYVMQSKHWLTTITQPHSDVQQ